MDLIIDIGGTNTRVAAADGNTLSPARVFPTPADPRAAVSAIAEASKSLGDTFQRVIAAVPGVLAADRLQLAWSPNLPGWQNEPLAAMLGRQHAAPVTLLNDADLAGVGEAVFGAGQGHRIVAYLTISTGIGGSRIIDGRIDAAASGFEPGHHIIDADGTLQPQLPSPATLEHLIGGASTERLHRQRPQDIKNAALWEHYARYLGIGLRNVVAFWSPHVIVIGGPMMRDIKRELAAKHLRRLMPSPLEAPPVLPAALPDDTRALQGALAFLRQD